LLGNIGPTELILILLIVMLIFGTSRLTGIGKSVGTAIRDFRESMKGEPPQKEKPPEETPKETGKSNE
jgi:sec-independent protein translocase protein TatA